MVSAVQTSRCPACNAVTNPRWSECIACGAMLGLLPDDSNSPDPPPAIVVCIICGEALDRTKAGWGALDGESLHMDCYRRRYPNGHR